MRYFCWKTIRPLFLNQQIAFLAAVQVLNVLLERSEIKGSFTVNLINEISKPENTYFHISTHFKIISTFPIFPYISDFSSNTFDTCTAARKMICWLRNKGRMVFQQKCLMQSRDSVFPTAFIPQLLHRKYLYYNIYGYYKPAGARCKPIKGSPGGNKLISIWLASL